MKIICETNKLSSACNNLQRVVSNKSTMVALECILLNATGENLVLTGYDLEIGSETSINAFIDEKGAVAISAKHLCDILRLLPEDKVKISTDEKSMCTITSGDAEYKIIGTPADVYPELPTVTDSEAIEMKQSVLKDMITRTCYAVAVVDTRPVHTGIKFDITEGMITLVALDGYRLAVRKEKIDYSGEPVSFIIPAKTFGEIIKYTDDEDNNVKIFKGERHIVIEVGNYRIISRLLEGDFLDYKAAIPSDFSITIKVDRKELIECVERVSLLSSTEKIKTPVRCLAENGEMKLSNTTSLGKAKDRCLADIDGNYIEIGFNGRYMTDALKRCDDDKIMLSLNRSNQPIIITPIEGDSYIHLILPMRLKQENEI